MLFSSLVFLYSFLPIVLLLNLLIQKRFRNPMLLIASLVFFAWGGVIYSLLLIASIIINYTSGLVIGKLKPEKLTTKAFLGLAIVANLGLLGVFKYTGFIIENINTVFSSLNLSTINDPGIVLPLGISFYTFQAISYIIDVYRNEAHVQKNIFKLALYISFFPQLIAGPIVRYSYIEEQLTKRKVHFSNISYGIQRFILGLSKKVLIANQFGAIADNALSLPAAELNTTTAWAGVISYTLQIYFDFSGYSDMAIGLGRMFGFKLPENFNFPYISKSIREFWTRWHITLGEWFKSYLYIPLGGNRSGKARVLFNLLLVFLATAIWHGASWNFVVWGMIHGVFMIIERAGFGKILQKAWSPIQHFYTLFIVTISWLFFKVEDLHYAWGIFKKLFSFETAPLHESIASTVATTPFIFMATVGLLSCTPIWLLIEKRYLKTYQKLSPVLVKPIVHSIQQLSVSAFIIIAALMCTALLINSTYNPFIYFRF